MPSILIEILPTPSVFPSKQSLALSNFVNSQNQVYKDHRPQFFRPKLGFCPKQQALLKQSFGKKGVTELGGLTTSLYGQAVGDEHRGRRMFVYLEVKEE